YFPVSLDIGIYLINDFLPFILIARELDLDSKSESPNNKIWDSFLDRYLNSSLLALIIDAAHQPSSDQELLDHVLNLLLTFRLLENSRSQTDLEKVRECPNLIISGTNLGLQKRF